MKSVKITAEVIITPEMFHKWCGGDFPETETVYKLFVEKQVYSKFGAWKDFGDYDDFINTTVENNGNGIKLSF